MTHCRAKSEPRSERARERQATITYWVLGYKLAFLTGGTLHHFSLRASSRYRPIARERRGLLDRLAEHRQAIELRALPGIPI
jgi:hypothetical protein